jgi:hypothetical protein
MPEVVDPRSSTAGDARPCAGRLPGASVSGVPPDLSSAPKHARRHSMAPDRDAPKNTLQRPVRPRTEGVGRSPASVSSPACSMASQRTGNATRRPPRRTRTLVSARDGFKLHSGPADVRAPQTCVRVEGRSVFSEARRKFSGIPWIFEDRVPSEGIGRSIELAANTLNPVRMRTNSGAWRLTFAVATSTVVAPSPAMARYQSPLAASSRGERGRTEAACHNGAYPGRQAFPR